MTEINNNAFRKMALQLLDDYDGVPIGAYSNLEALLKETGNEDIVEHVEIYKDAKRHCAFIGEDYAEEELAKLAEIEEADEADDGE